jgi:hypothetical protein
VTIVSSGTSTSLTALTVNGSCFNCNANFGKTTEGLVITVNNGGVAYLGDLAKVLDTSVVKVGNMLKAVVAAGNFDTNKVIAVESGGCGEVKDAFTVGSTWTLAYGLVLPTGETLTATAKVTLGLGVGVGAPGTVSTYLTS